MLSGIRSSVTEGHSLAEAISRYPRSFPDIYTASVAAGEQSGNLDEVLERLADYIETRQGIQQRIGVALIYPHNTDGGSHLDRGCPAGLCRSSGGQGFRGHRAETTGAHRNVNINKPVYGGLLDFWLIAIVIFAITAGILTLKNSSARLKLHEIFLKTPGIRRLSRGVNTARMSRTLAIMAGSGVPFLSAIRASEGVMSNLVLRQNLADAAAEIARKGQHTPSSGTQRKLSPSADPDGCEW